MKSYCSFWCVSRGNVCLYSIPIILSPLNFRSTIYRSLMLMDSRYLYPLYNTMVTCYTFEPIFHHTSRLFSIYTTLLIIIFLFSTYLQLATKSFALSYCRHRRIAIHPFWKKSQKHDPVRSGSRHLMSWKTKNRSVCSVNIFHKLF